MGEIPELHGPGLVLADQRGHSCTLTSSSQLPCKPQESASRLRGGILKGGRRELCFKAGRQANCSGPRRGGFSSRGFVSEEREKALSQSN